MPARSGGLDRQAGHVTARPCQTRDQASAERVVGRPEHDWNSRRRLLGREHCASHGDDNIDFEPDELACDLSEAFRASLRPTNLDPDSAAIHPAEFAQSLYERGELLALDRSRARAQEADGRQFSGLLCARRERPSRRAAEQGYELAPLDAGHGDFLPSRVAPPAPGRQTTTIGLPYAHAAERPTSPWAGPESF